MWFGLISLPFALFIRPPLANCYFPRFDAARCVLLCSCFSRGAAAAASTVSPLSRLYCSRTWGSLDVRLQIALVIHIRTSSQSRNSFLPVFDEIILNFEEIENGISSDSENINAIDFILSEIKLFMLDKLYRIKLITIIS